MKGHKGDEKEIKRQFREGMKDDLAGLRDELHFNWTDIVFSKEMAGGPDLVSEQGQGAPHAIVACGGFYVSGCKRAPLPQVAHP